MIKNILNFKIFPAILLFAGSITGCLKDEGYDNGEYGSITGNTAGSKYVSIPAATRNPNVLGLVSKAGMQDVDLFSFSYDYEKAAESEITATVALNNALITDPAITILPTSAYAIPSLSQKFKVGQVISDPFKIQINTSLLDPAKKYGIAFTLSQVSDGIAIPSNLKNVIFTFTIKNKYDGVYSFRGRMDIPPDRSPDWVRTPFTYPYNVQLITTGPNTCKFYNEAFGQGFHPLMTPGTSGFGQTEATFTFDASDNITSVVNSYSPVTNGRAYSLNTSVSGSKYDAANKKVYAAYIMTQPGFAPMPLYDTLTYIKSR
jgi:hypothetical protein